MLSRPFPISFFRSLTCRFSIAHIERAMRAGPFRGDELCLLALAHRPTRTINSLPFIPSSNPGMPLSRQPPIAPGTLFPIRSWS